MLKSKSDLHNSEMRFVMKAIMAIGGVAVFVGADKWFNLFQSYLDKLYPHLSDYTLISLIIGVVIIGVYAHLTKNSEKKKEQPILELEPLNITKETRFNPSQFINMVWASGMVKVEEGKTVENKLTQNQLNARFGIIRFRNTGVDAIGCCVEAKYLANIVNSNEKIWINEGHLNWFSQSKRSKISEVKDIFELHKIFENTVENIHQNEEKDLQVCYSTDGRNVILCSDMRYTPLGVYDDVEKNTKPNWN